MVVYQKYQTNWVARTYEAISFEGKPKKLKLTKNRNPCNPYNSSEYKTKK